MTSYAPRKSTPWKSKTRLRLATPRKCASERAAIDVLDLTSDRHSAGDTGRQQIAPPRKLPDVVGGGLTLDGGVGSENNLTHHTPVEQGLELGQTQLLWSNTVKRRQPPHQYEIRSTKGPGLFQGHEICRRLDDTQKSTIASWRAANGADLGFTEIIALLAMADTIDGAQQGLGDVTSHAPVAPQQVECHTLRGLGAYARQAT